MTVKVPAVAHRELVLSTLVIAGASLDRQGEGLGGGSRHAVGGRDRKHIRPAHAHVGRTRERGRAVPLSTNVTPVGSAPVSVSGIGIGMPVVVTVNVPNVPTVNVVLAVLVIAGGWSTVKVNVWVASGATPFVAVIVTE